MNFSSAEIIQIAVQVVGLMALYTRMKTDIEVIKTRLRYIEQRLKIVTIDEAVD